MGIGTLSGFAAPPGRHSRLNLHGLLDFCFVGAGVLHNFGSDIFFFSGFRLPEKKKTECSNRFFAQIFVLCNFRDIDFRTIPLTRKLK